MSIGSTHTGCIYTLSIFSTCKMIRALWVGYAFWKIGCGKMMSRIKLTLLTNFAAFIAWVASTDACVIACLTVSINCTIGTWVNTISIFSTCEVIRTTWVCYAFYTISIFSTCEVVRATWVLVQCYMVVKAGSLPMRTFYWINHINCYQIKESFVVCTLP